MSLLSLSAENLPEEVQKTVVDIYLCKHPVQFYTVVCVVNSKLKDYEGNWSSLDVDCSPCGTLQKLFARISKNLHMIFSEWPELDDILIQVKHSRERGSDNLWLDANKVWNETKICTKILNAFQEYMQQTRVLKGCWTMNCVFLVKGKDRGYLSFIIQYFNLSSLIF